MSLLCIRRTLTAGWRHGLAIGSGIAIGDSLYGAVAALGLSSLSGFMLEHEKPLHIAAGLLLIYLGLKSLRGGTHNAHEANAVSVRGWRKELATSVLLTIANPPTIVMFAAVFTALAPTGGFRLTTALITVAGVFAGSLLWWLMIVASVSSLRHAIGHKARVWIDRISGVILTALGMNELRRGIVG